MVRGLLPRIEARAHPGMPVDGVHQWGAEVVVHTTDGRHAFPRRASTITSGAGLAAK